MDVVMMRESICRWERITSVTTNLIYTYQLLLSDCHIRELLISVFGGATAAFLRLLYDFVEGFLLLYAPGVEQVSSGRVRKQQQLYFR